MKYQIRVLVIALIVGGWGLMATGCDEVEEMLDDLSGDRQEEADDDEVAEDDDADDDEDEVAEVEEEPEDDPVDVAMYILAAFEVECVDQEIEDEDEAQEIKDEIYARYGFDAAGFEEAAEKVGEQDAVRMAIDASMDRCSEELAQGLLESGADEIELADLDLGLDEEFGQAQFITAAYHVRCIEEHVDDDDEATAAKQVVFDEHGLTEESFDEVQEVFEGNEAVQAGINIAMERCDEQMAQGMVAAAQLQDADPEEVGGFIAASFSLGCMMETFEVDAEDDDQARGFITRHGEDLLSHFDMDFDSFDEAGEEYAEIKAIGSRVEEAQEYCEEELGLGLVAQGPELFEGAEVNEYSFLPSAMQDEDSASHSSLRAAIGALSDEVSSDLDEVEDSPELRLSYVTTDHFIECVQEHWDDDEDHGFEDVSVDYPATSADQYAMWQRVGFLRTEESIFEKVEEEFSDEEEVEMVREFIADEYCDDERAFALVEGTYEEWELTYEELVEKAEEAQQPAPAQPQARPEPARTGRMNASISGGDFERTSLEITVRSDYNVQGRLRGQREGRGFQIPFTGQVSQDGSVRARGRQGQDTILVEGQVSQSGVRGTITGDVHQRNYNLRYNAN